MPSRVLGTKLNKFTKLATLIRHKQTQNGYSGHEIDAYLTSTLARDNPHLLATLIQLSGRQEAASTQSHQEVGNLLDDGIRVLEQQLSLLTMLDDEDRLADMETRPDFMQEYQQIENQMEASASSAGQQDSQFKIKAYEHIFTKLERCRLQNSVIKHSQRNNPEQLSRVQMLKQQNIKECKKFMMEQLGPKSGAYGSTFMEGPADLVMNEQYIELDCGEEE